MKDYNRARVYLDKNYKSQEHFTVSAVSWFLLAADINICTRWQQLHPRDEGPDLCCGKEFIPLERLLWVELIRS